MRKLIVYLAVVISTVFFLSNLVFGEEHIIQHLDATNEESIVTNGSVVVTEWKDQTSFANNAMLSTGAIYKFQKGELTWLDFGSERNALKLFSSSKSDVWLDQSNIDGFCVLISIFLLPPQVLTRLKFLI